MKVAIITSSEDPASQNMYEHLTGSFKESGEEFDGYPVLEIRGIRLYHSDRSMIHMEKLDEEIEADLFLFASRHSSRSGIPSYTCHVPGNWGKAEFGGSDSKLCVAPTAVVKHALQKIVTSYQGDTHDVVQEVVHHGPLLRKPCLFMEIGSIETEWVKPKNGSFMAKMVLDVAQDIIAGKIDENVIPTVGIGGTHTASNFREIMLHTEYAVGQICAKYALEALTLDTLRQALTKNYPKPAKLILVDYKGLGNQKSRVKEMLERLSEEGIGWKKTSEVKPRN